MSEARLQKIIADQGLASRREAEQWIVDGYVRVNGKVAKLGDKAELGKDAIKVKGKLLQAGKQSKPKRVVLMLNKPRGYLCSNNDPHHEKTVFNLVPKGYAGLRLFCAGRLDKESQGLVIITNDGDLAHRIMHPSFGLIKKYNVELSQDLDTKIIPKLLKGKHVEGERLAFEKVIPASGGIKSGQRCEVHLREGKKREIRRLFAAFGCFVNKLKRIQIGKLTMRGLKPGAIRELTAEEVAELL